MRKHLLVGAIVCAGAPGVRSQTIGPERPVAKGTSDANGASLVEPAVTVNPLKNMEIAVAWNRRRLADSSRTVEHRISNDGGASWTGPASALPLLAGCSFNSSVDPVAAFDSDGCRWLGVLQFPNGDTFARVLVGRILPRGAAIDPPMYVATASCTVRRDKPWLIVGPRRDGTGDTMHVTYNIAVAPGDLRDNRCKDAAPLGTVWPNEGGRISGDPPNPQTGAATSIAIVSNGVRRGRVIVVLSGFFGSPLWTRSDDDGTTWSQPQVTTSSALGQAGELGGLPTAPGVTARPFPSTATAPADGVDPGLAVIVFAAESASLPGNVDLFIAVSTDSGETFPEQNVYRIDDKQLLAPGEAPGQTDQVMPAVAIDPLGGINLLYVNSRDSDVSGGITRVAVRYARFPSVASLTGPAFVRDLSPLFALTSQFRIGAGAHDYQMIVSAGCALYAAYAYPADGGVGSIFVRRITVGPCGTADADTDGAVTAADVALFSAAFPVAGQAADVNMDDRVNARDVLDFMGAFARGREPR
jgi:hypothetical protein